MFSSTLVALAALPLAFAQYYPQANATSTYAPSASGTAAPAVQTVTVGLGGLIFTPDTIHAKAGEKIAFEFYPKNHSVVQADFDNPCNPSDNAIFSGFFPTTAPGPNEKTFEITVKDDKPIWLYCAALLPSPHCAQGMVAVINPPASGPNTLEAFREAANKTTTSTVPSTINNGDAPSASPTDQPGAASSLIVSKSAIGGLVAAFAAFML